MSAAACSAASYSELLNWWCWSVIINMVRWIHLMFILGIFLTGTEHQCLWNMWSPEVLIFRSSMLKDWRHSVTSVTDFISLWAAAPTPNGCSVMFPPGDGALPLQQASEACWRVFVVKHDDETCFFTLGLTTLMLSCPNMSTYWLQMRSIPSDSVSLPVLGNLFVLAPQRRTNTPVSSDQLNPGSPESERSRWSINIWSLITNSMLFICLGQSTDCCRH